MQHNHTNSTVTLSTHLVPTFAFGQLWVFFVGQGLSQGSLAQGTGTGSGYGYGLR